MMSARTIVTVLLCCAAPALAAYHGTITAPDVVLEPGQTKTVEITITGPVMIEIISLNVQIGNGAWPAYTGGPRLADVDLVSPGLLFHNRDLWQERYLITEQMVWAVACAPNQGQFYTVPEGETRTLGRVTIEAGYASGVWPLSLTSLNGPTDYGELAAHKPLLIDGRIWVPEPASLMLLIVGAGLALRRARVPCRR